MVCYQGNCVDMLKVIKNVVPSAQCSPNPCLNGGKCMTSHLYEVFFCNCPLDYTGKCKLKFDFEFI